MAVWALPVRTAVAVWACGPEVRGPDCPAAPHCPQVSASEEPVYQILSCVFIAYDLNLSLSEDQSNTVFPFLRAL